VKTTTGLAQGHGIDTRGPVTDEERSAITASQDHQNALTGPSHPGTKIEEETEITEEKEAETRKKAKRSLNADRKEKLRRCLSRPKSRKSSLSAKTAPF
jgi:hypothetical protein